MLETGSAVVYGDYFACVDFDLNHKLDLVQVPTLLIASDNDRMVRMEDSEETATKLGATFVGLEECGHFQHIEQTAKCATALSEFLTEVADAG